MTNPILAFDLDGTLFDENGLVYPQDRPLLENCPDAQLVICTGRQLHSIRKSFAESGLFLDRPLPFPLVLSNGGILYLPGEQIAEQRPFPADVHASVAAMIRRLDDVPFLVQNFHRMGLVHGTPFTYDLARQYGIDLVEIDPHDLNQPLVKVMAWSDNREQLKAAEAAARELDVETSYSTEFIFEMNPRGVNKGEGLRRLMALLGMQDSAIIAAGDGGNDIEMLRVADYAFTPCASPDEVKAVANEIIDPRARGLLTPMLERARRDFANFGG